MPPPPNAFVLPISQLLDRADWPRDFFGPPGHFGVGRDSSDSAMDQWLDVLLSRVFFSDYTVVENRDHAGFHIDLWIHGALDFSVSPFYGFEFAVVDPDALAGVPPDEAEGTWVRIPTTVRVGVEFEVVFHAVDLVIRLPRDIFQTRSTDANPRAADPFRVEVPMAGRLRIDATFDVDFVPQGPVSFGPIELFESGFTLTVTDAVLDLSRAQNLDAIRGADLPDDFRGFFARKVIIQLPPWLFPDEEWEAFAENLAIGTGGLHGTIGARQTTAITVDPADQATVYAKAGGAVVLDGPVAPGMPTFPEVSRRFLLLEGQFAPVIGRAFSDVPLETDEWYFIDTTRIQDDDLRRLDIGYGWVRGADVERFGNFDAVPRVHPNVLEPFTEGFLSVGIGPLDLRFEQFFITFRDTVPLPGIKANLRIPVGDRESLQIVLTVDSDLRFSARVSETPSTAPLPDRDRLDTFALAPNDLIIGRLDAIDLGARRLRRSDDPHLEDEWEFHVLADLSLFFFWGDGDDLSDKNRRGVSLTGLGVRGTKKDYDEGRGVLALPSPESLRLSPGKDGGKLFDKPLSLGPLAFSVDGVGVGVELSGAFFLSLSGKIALTTALKLEGVAGVRFRWGDGEYLGMAFEKASIKVDTAVLKGELGVEFVDEMALVTDPSQPGTQVLEQRRGFRGRGRFEMQVPPRIFVDLEAAFGDRPTDHMFFFVSVGSRTSGVPVGPIAFYGISGLIGYNFVPDKAPAQEWYEDWFRDKAPAFSATSVDKWRVQEGAWAAGLGTIIGTSADQGRTVNAQVIFVMSKPGPIVLFAGHGNLFRSMAELAHPERAMLKLLLVYDGLADTLAVTAGLRYQRPAPDPDNPADPDAGSKLDARGLVDVFWDLSRSDNWHVYFGERPKEKRVRGRVWKLAQADIYVMVDPERFELGVSAGFEKKLSWKKAKLELAAWAELVFGIIYEPDQVFGGLAIGGSARASIYGFGLGLTFEVSGQVAFLRPRRWSAEFKLRLKTPWFLPDYTVHWHWGSSDELVPPTPIPLQGAASTHDLTATDLPLSLHPDVDPDGDRVVDGPVDTSFDEAEAVGAAPIVPLDSKPLLRFGHPINERTGLARNPDGSTHHEAFGEEGAFRYDLVRIALWKRPRGSAQPWQLLDERVVGDDREPVEWSDYIADQRIFGTTRLDGTLLYDGSFGDRTPVGLRLWATTPFYSHAGGDQEAEEALEDDPDLPCPPAPDKPDPTCEGYDRFAIGEPLPRSHRLDEVWLHSPSGGRVVAASGRPVGVYDPGPAGGAIRVVLPERSASVLVRLAVPTALRWAAGRDADPVREDAGVLGAINIVDPHGVDWIEVSIGQEGAVAAAIAVPRPIRLAIVEVCYTAVAALDALETRLVADEAVRAAFPDGVDLDAQTMLEPDQDYKLQIETEVRFSEEQTPTEASWQTARTFVQHAYFRTAGPPGMLPTDSSLRDLLHYVDHEVPHDGAGAHYRGYDVAIVFRDDATVRGMYTRSGEALKLVVSDGADQITARSDGPADLLEVTWAELPSGETHRVRALWDDIVRRSPCGDPAPPRGGDALVGTPRRLLHPRRAYRVTVELASAPTFRRDRLEAGDLAAMTRVTFGPEFGGLMGVWELADGALVHGGPDTPPAPPAPVTAPSGSAVVVGDASWRNYRVAVDVTLAVGRVGVIAGYQDPENFYALTVDANAHVELVRMQAGAWTVLADAQLATPSGATTYRLEVVWTGQWLEAIVDGESRATAVDATFRRGRVGLLTAFAVGATFARLRVHGNPLYASGFTTSRFAHFKDHIASFDGSLARRPSSVPLADVASELTAALAEFPGGGATDAATGEQRQRTFDTLMDLLQVPVGDADDALEISAIETPDGPAAFLIESPEPLQWATRTTVALFRQRVDAGAVWVDPDTLRLHPARARLHPRRVRANDRLAPLGNSTGEREPPGVDEQAPVALMEAVGRLNPRHLRLTMGHDGDGAFFELVARGRAELGGRSLNVRRNGFEPVFRFPAGLVLEPGDVLQLRGLDGGHVAAKPGVRVLTVADVVLGELASGGTVVRLDGLLGVPELVEACPPVARWEAIDPASVRLVYDADTRQALVFVTDGGRVRPLPAGHYRFDFRFARDVGVPARRLSFHGSAAPETASVVVLLSGVAAPEAPVRPQWRLRLVLRELSWSPQAGAGGLAPSAVAARVRIRSGSAASVETVLPQFRIDPPGPVVLNMELFDGAADDRGLDVSLELVDLPRRTAAARLELCRLGATEAVPTRTVAAAEGPWSVRLGVSRGVAR